MINLDRIKFKEKGFGQEYVGRSLIHRCCKKRMEIIENTLHIKNAKAFYVCRNCGGIEIPYIAQLLGYNPENFFRSSKTEVRFS